MNPKSRGVFFVSVVLCLAAYLIYVPFRKQKVEEPMIAHPRGGLFAGSDQCLACHQQIHQSFQQTAHSRSTAIASLSTVSGSFDEGKNELYFRKLDKVVMKSLDSGLYQIGFKNNKMIGSQRFDLVVGSGTKGQTYLHWRGDKLVQLPAAFNVAEQRWAPGPSSAPDRYVFNRSITAGCLNCHSTYWETYPKMNEPPDFDKDLMILGISCERCHGPSLYHVEAMKEGRGISNAVNPRRLKRKQQLDLCAQCHSSIRKSPGAPFHFLPGDSLYQDQIVLNRIDTSANAEVHGNQFDLLSVSKCFLKSADMTCSTCHNPHQQERGKVEVFSARCMNCHQEHSAIQKFCTFKSIPSNALKSNCIDCHMPVRASKKITFVTDKKSRTSAELARSHFISINPSESKKIAEMLNSK